MQGADILDQRDPIGKPFAGSLMFHGGLLALILVSPFLAPKPITLGDPNAHSGQVGISITKTIPIPQRDGRVNRLANDSQSIVPMEPQPKITPKPAVKDPPVPKDAIRIPTKEQTKPKKRETPSALPYLSDEPMPKNQVFSQRAPALKSEMMGMQGQNGIGTGPSNPFGEQFGWYATQVKDRIAQKWNRANVTAAPHATVLVEFLFERDGNVKEVKVLKPSGSFALDTSAQRAILDANPLPPFPRGFNFTSVKFDLTFGLDQ